MKFSRFAVAAAALIIICGCDNKPKESAGGWKETPAAEEPSGSATTAPAASNPAPPADTGIVLKGSDFKLDGNAQEQVHHGDVMQVGHYFAAWAPLELKTSTTQVFMDVEGKKRNNAVPLMGLRVTSTSGKYVDNALEPRPIDGPQKLQDPMELGPGSYKVSVTYFKDTGKGDRPSAIVNSVTFK